MRWDETTICKVLLSVPVPSRNKTSEQDAPADCANERSKLVTETK